MNEGKGNALTGADSSDFPVPHLRPKTDPVLKHCVLFEILDDGQHLEIQYY